MDKKEKEKQYIYIVQSSLEPSWCKIGKTNNLNRRLKEYNNMTGKSQDNIYKYLFTCEVKNNTQVEKDVKKEFSTYRQVASKEMYLFNPVMFGNYVKFIKEHPLFVEEIFIKTEEKKEVIKYIKRVSTTLEERGLTPKDIIEKARRKSDDEFYTQYEDIEKELAMYDKNIWKNKCVFCNCDDPVGNDESRTSAFALYFLQNFKNLKLKKLICTHYSSKVDLFNAGARGYIFTKDGCNEIKDDYEKMKVYPKDYNGSFDHPLSLKILNEEADIVCTNPPFSRAKDYWKLVIESGKKFLFIGNFVNTIHTAYIHYFKDNKVWAGYNDVYWFLNPKKQIVKASGHWYTNFPVINRPKYINLKIIPLKEIPEKYKRYDDSDILLVDFNYIPSNYEKPFAVSAYPILSGVLEKGYKIVQEKRHNVYINGKEKFARVLVQKV